MEYSSELRVSFTLRKLRKLLLIKSLRSLRETKLTHYPLLNDYV